MCKRVLSFVLCALLVVSCFPVSIFADTDDAAFTAALKTFLACNNITGEPSDATKFTWSTVISILKADNRNTNVIASVCGCMLYESTGQIFAVEGHSHKNTTDGKQPSQFEVGHSYEYASDVYPGLSPRQYKKNGTYHNGGGSAGNGHGIIQWSFGRANNLSDFCTSSEFPAGCGYITVTHNAWVDNVPRWPENLSTSQVTVSNSYWQRRSYNIPDMPGQVAFMCKEFNGSYASTIAAVSNASSIDAALESFLTNYMGGADATGTAKRKTAANAAVAMVEACGGTVGSAPTTIDPTTGQPVSPYGTQAGYQGLGASMVNMGYWSEAQLQTYCSLTETNLEETLLQVADRSNLQQVDLESLTDWDRNKENNEREYGYISILRWVTMLVGILMTVWALLIYLAFWFDHINSFFYLDVLHIVTLGQLHICPPGDTPSFKLGTSVKDRTVSHAQVVGICLIAILFGALLISGVFYVFVGKAINLVLEFIKSKFSEG